MNNLLIKLIKIPRAIHFRYDQILAKIYKRNMKVCGYNVNIFPSYSNFRGLSNLSIGNNVHISMGATIFCTEAPLTIGNNVIFAPNVSIITGDHRINEIGVFMVNSKNKLPENDQPVTIEDDVWCGINVTILKGVTIGRGSIIAAGSIVCKSCPPYSIIGGNPAKIIKYRYNIEEIMKHEESLYPAEMRYSKEKLEKTRVSSR